MTQSVGLHCDDSEGRAILDLKCEAGSQHQSVLKFEFIEFVGAVNELSIKDVAKFEKSGDVARSDPFGANKTADFVDVDLIVKWPQPFNRP